MKTNCPFCPDASVKKIYGNIYKCGKCFFIFSADTGKTEYDKNYYEKYYLPRQKELETFFGNFLKNFKFPRGLTWLDAGCGAGFFLNEASKRFNTVGIDRSFEACRLTKESGHKAVNASIENFKFSEKFDFISFFNVISASDDIVSVFNSVKENLNEDGFLIIKEINFPEFMFKTAAIIEKIFPFDMKGLFHLPRFKNFFNFKNIKNIAHREGFDITAVYDASYGSKKYSKNFLKNAAVKIFFKILSVFGYFEDVIFVLKPSSPRKNIVSVITALNIGGTENFLKSIVLNTKNDYRRTVWCVKNKGAVADILQNSRVFVRAFEFYSFLEIKKMRLLYLNYKLCSFDIMETFLYRANIAMRFMKMFAKKGIIISHHQSVDLWRKFYHNIIDKLTARYVNLFIANSNAVAEFLREKISPRLPVKVFYYTDCGFDAAQLEKKEFNYSCGVLCRLHKSKNLILLIRAFKLAAASYPQSVLYIYGEGPEEEALKNEIQKLDIKENVKLMPFTFNTKRFYEKIDIFILPSLWEGLSNSLACALLARKICVVSGIPSNTEIIKHNENGIVFNKNSADDLALALKKVFSDEALREKLSNSPPAVLELFNKEKRLKEYRQIIKECVENENN